MWKDLELKDKARIMGLAVKSGITDLRNIEEVYNKFEDGGPLSIWDPQNLAWTPGNSTRGPIDHAELERRQAWAESKDRNLAISPKGAKGKYQIMPMVYEAYVRETGDKGNIFTSEYNKKIRDWQMKQIQKSKYIQNPELTDSLRVGREYYAYNAGLGNLGKALNKAKEAGVDINNSWDWMEYGYEEPKNYVNFIVRNKDTGGNRTNKKYNRHKLMTKQ